MIVVAWFYYYRHRYRQDVLFAFCVALCATLTGIGHLLNLYKLFTGDITPETAVRIVAILLWPISGSIGYF